MPLIRIVSALLLLVLFVEAETSRGLYGELGWRYEQYDRIDRYGETERGTFLQDYSMGYSSYLLSPLFLMYDIEATLHYEDTDVIANGYEQNRKIRGIEYDIDLSFIQKTNYPFRVYAVKSQRPYWDVTLDRSYYLDEDSERVGIDGLARLELFNLRYSAEIFDITRAGSNEEEERTDIRYTLSLDKQMSSSYLTMNYIYNDREQDRTLYASDYVSQDTNYQIHEVTNDANIKYDWKISPTLKLNAWGRYFDNNNSNYVDTLGNVALQWRPNSKYTATIDATVDRFKSDFGELKTMSLGATSDYRVSEFLTLDQSLTMMSSSGDFGEYDSNYFRMGGRYHKPLGDDYTLRADGYITLNRNRSAISDLNETEYENSIVTYSAGSGISKYYVPLKGTLSFDVRYLNREATASESMQVASAKTLFIAKPLYNLSYSLGADYAKEYSDFSSSLVYNDREDIVSDRYGVDTGVKYSTSLTRKGRISAEAGVSHRVHKDNIGTSVIRTLPRGSLDLQYRPIRSLTFTAHGSVYQDVQAETTTYTAKSDLMWNVRQTIVRLGALYTEQVGGLLGEKQDTRLHAEIRRKF